MTKYQDINHFNFIVFSIITLIGHLWLGWNISTIVFFFLIHNILNIPFHFVTVLKHCGVASALIYYIAYLVSYLVLFCGPMLFFMSFSSDKNPDILFKQEFATLLIPYGLPLISIIIASYIQNKKYLNQKIEIKADRDIFFNKNLGYFGLYSLFLILTSVILNNIHLPQLMFLIMFIGYNFLVDNFYLKKHNINTPE